MNLPSNIVKLLLLDHCSAHLKDSVMKAVRENGHIDFIPPGSTSLLQPLDLMINKPFKDYLRDIYGKWLEEKGTKDNNKTKKGYFKPPKYTEIIKWVHEAWGKISPELIKDSFKYAGNFFTLVI